MAELQAVGGQARMPAAQHSGGAGWAAGDYLKPEATLYYK